MRMSWSLLWISSLHTIAVKVMCVVDWLPEIEQKDALSRLCSDGAPIMLGFMRSHLHAKFHVSQIQQRDCIQKNYVDKCINQA